MFDVGLRPKDWYRTLPAITRHTTPIESRCFLFGIYAVYAVFCSLMVGLKGEGIGGYWDHGFDLGWRSVQQPFSPPSGHKWKLYLPKSRASGGVCAAGENSLHFFLDVFFLLLVLLNKIFAFKNLFQNK